jgi:diadenosine tetraphosphate (Ap4A) HIT family hydrolase
VAEPRFRCRDCGFELFLPIVKLRCSVLGLYDDGRYPGRSLLAYEEHAEDFASLEPDQLLSFSRDMQLAASAISAVVRADRMNYAILGNAAPHLHAHLIPRKRDGDPVPDRSPWNHPDAVYPLPQADKLRLIATIRDEVENRLD